MRRSLALSGAVIVVWCAAMALTGLGPRALDNLPAAITMIFGSFVAGSTPQGGGAVAFPVFTKVLDVAAADARTFSLCIQAIGMGTASLAIALTGRPVDTGALRLTVPSATAGYLTGVVAFATFTPPGPPLKVLFTLVIATTGAATWVSQKRGSQNRTSVMLNEPARRWLMTAAGLGGLASSLFGSGADVAVYLVLAIALGLRAGIAVATSVVTMAAVSIVGLAVSVATGALSMNPTGSTDVFGMWIAAIPVVVVGAPLGSWFASKVAPDALASFIAGLAGLELLSTVVFLDELRSEPSLSALLAAGLTTIWFCLDRFSFGRLAPPEPTAVHSGRPRRSRSSPVTTELH